MANLPEGFEIVSGGATGSGLPEGFEVVQLPPLQEQAAQPAPAEQPQEKGFLDKASDMFTGADRMTPEMESMGEIGSAPEMNEMSMGAFKSSLGLLTTGDEEKATALLQENIPNAEFTKDSKGNVIVNLPSGQYALNKPGMSAQDVLRGAFNMAAFTPAARLGSLGGVAAGSAATEAAIQGATKGFGGGDINPIDIALSGAIGGAGKGLENVIGAGYRALKGQVPEEAAGVIAQGKEYGVPVMTSDVIQPTTSAGKIARSTGEKIPFAGTGQARASQQEARGEAVQSFADKYQAPSYSEIVDSMKMKSKGVKTAAGNILGKTGDKLDSVGDIPTENTATAIGDAMESLSKPNVRVDQSAIDELTELKNLMDMPQTFTSLKENRTIARDILDSFGKGDRSQLPSRSKALVTKAVNGMSRDMDEFAKSNLTPREYSSWKRANAVYADEATKLRKSRIKNILDKSDVTPENVNTMLFSKKPSEVKMLYESLTTKGKDNARAALIDKAVGNASRRAGGLSPNSFSSELNKITPNTGVFFRGEERKQLEGFKRLMESTRQAQDAAIATPTGQQMLGVAAGASAITDLGATLGAGATAGGLARAYESPAVRNALLRLASVPRDSDRFLKALSEARAALTSVAQAERSE